MRSSDIAARTSESEFTVVLTVTDKDGAIEFAERTRTLVQATDFVISIRRIM